ISCWSGVQEYEDGSDRLAHDQRTGMPQLLHDLRVVCRYEIAEGRRPHRRAKLSRVEHVLDGNRYSVKWSTKLLVVRFGLELSRFGKQGLAVNRHKRFHT